MTTSQVQCQLRQWSMPVALFAIGYLGFFGYSHVTRHEHAGDAANLAARATLHAQRSLTGVRSALPVANAGTSSLPTIPSDTVDRWIVEATDDDPRTRAAALTALATAPKSQAVSVLQRVLDTGEPKVDRQLALRSLHTLALTQGDADGAIRDAIRRAISHGDDTAIANDAQAVLEDIEGGGEPNGPSTPSVRRAAPHCSSFGSIALDRGEFSHCTMVSNA